MCKTHKIAEQLGVKILKRLQGDEVLDIPETGPLEDGVYLVEKEGEKFVLKTGHFNANEIDDNWALAELGVKTQIITESVLARDVSRNDAGGPEEYILYEYIDAPLLAKKDFWSDTNLQRVFDLHAKIATGLQDKSMTDGQVKDAVEWIQTRPLGDWLQGSGLTEAEQAEILKTAEAHATWKTPEGLSWLYRDNNANHYLDLGDELAVVDIDISIRPKHYMDMRYLAWVILWMPADQLSLAWVQSWVEKLGASPERYITFLMSLVGILWDIQSNGTYAKSQTERVDIIKQIIKWVTGELNKLQN